MPFEHFIGYRQERLVRASAALDLGFVAQARHPFVAARRSVARLTSLGILPALGEDIFTPAKERPEERYLLAGRRAIRDRPFRLRTLLFSGACSLKLGKPGLQSSFLVAESSEPLAN